jgi:peptidyl-prolyl cis-trans isomerase SurA
MIREQGFAYEDYFDLIRISVAKKNLIDADIRTRVSVSDDDVKNYYYNRYAKDSKTPKVFSFKMLTISPHDYKSGGDAKNTLERGRKEVLAGESFDEVAKRLSPTGAIPDLARLSEDQMTPQIRSAIQQLKIGDVSPVLGTSETYFYLVKLLDISAEDQERFEKMKEEIRGQLAAGEYQRQIGLWLERQRSSSYIRKKSERKKG